jgi:hypothetical protein
VNKVLRRFTANSIIVDVEAETTRLIEGIETLSSEITKDDAEKHLTWSNKFKNAKVPLESVVNDKARRSMSYVFS